MLIVMHDRYMHFLSEFFFNLEALRCFNILQVNSAKCWFQRFNDVDKFIRILFIDFNIKHIDAGKFFKEYAFSFHHRLGRFRSDIAQAEYSCAVGNHCHQISFGGVLVNIIGIGGNFFARLGHTG